MPVQFQRAQRKKAKLRLGLAGPAGSGKTFSALQIAFGLGGRIAMIDTERGSGELYSHLGEYDVCTLEAPFTPEKYVEAIRAAEVAGYEVIIIDSLTHAWAGTGGVLDIHGHAADKGGNSWTAWRQVTPRHNDLVDAMLQSKCHVIATLRSKMDHIQTTENGKTVIKKVGLNPIQREGMDYEFTVFLDLEQSHLASASKDRTSLFDGQVFKPTKETGRQLLGWLEQGQTNDNPTANILDFPPTGPIPAPSLGSSPAPRGQGGEKETAASPIKAQGEKTGQHGQQKSRSGNSNQEAKEAMSQGQGKVQAQAQAQSQAQSQAQAQTADDPFWNSLDQMDPPPARAVGQGNGRRRLF